MLPAVFPLPARLRASEPTLDGVAARSSAGVGIDELLLAEQDRLRRLVHRLLGWPADRATVDDVVQDVLLAAWRHRAGFRGEATPTTWLVAIAVRQAQRHRRWRRVRDRVAGWFAPENVAIEVPCAAQDRDDHAAMRAAMARLSSGDRAVLVLRYLEDRPIGEVAAVLGCSRAAIDQRLTRARDRLRTLLDRKGRE